jgi:cytochrome c-type biogenesis protein CcmH/NrfG
MNTPTDWTSAVAILAGGLILGMLFVYFFSRRKSAPTLGDDSDLELKDLHAKRDALVQQLRAVGPDTSDEERLRLENEAAAVLRQIDAHRPARVKPSAAAARPSSSSSMSPALQGVLWGTGSFLLLALLAYLVWKQSTPKEPMAAQQAPMQQQQQQARVNPMVAQLEAAVQKDPENIQLRNDLAQAYLETENLMGVFNETKIILAKNPDDSRALAMGGLVRLAMGEADAAVTMLQHATRSDRRNLDAWVGLAWVYSQTGKPKEADAAIAEAIRISPENKARLEEVLGQMKGQPLPPNHPPVDGAAQAAAAPAPSSAPADAGSAIRISIEIDPSAQSRANMSGVLYVIARGVPGAPPVAVKRLDPHILPATIDISQADSMMGQPIPDSVRIEVRLDSDGDALTKPATDPSASRPDVRRGRKFRIVPRVATRPIPHLTRRRPVWTF